ELQLPPREAVLDAPPERDPGGSEAPRRRVVVRRGEEARLERLARQVGQRERWVVGLQLDVARERPVHPQRIVDRASVTNGMTRTAAAHPSLVTRRRGRGESAAAAVPAP